MQQRKCRICEDDKDETEFNLLQGGRGGLRDECTECQAKLAQRQVKSRSRSSQASSWAKNTFNSLNLTDSDY